MANGTTAGGPVVAGAPNLRDIGGLAVGGGRTRSGVLYRSGSLAHLTDAGTSALQALGLRRVIDLREDDEVAYEPSRTADLGIETVRVPLFLGSTASLFTEDLSLETLYRGLIDTSADRIVAVVRAVLGGHPTLVHCTAGKDRTGVTIALMLAAVGVDEDAIVADYARTEALLDAERNARIVAHLRRLHPGAEHLVDLATRSPAPVMRALLGEMGRRFDSVPDYLLASGLVEEELTELRRMLVEP